MMIRAFLATALFALLLMPAPSQARVMMAQQRAFFINLNDGDTVTSPVNVKFGSTGVTIAPAGTETPGTGHFHLLIDVALSPGQMKLPIPSDAQHIHYGKGQTEDTVTLSPGKHTLQLIIGDGHHVPLDPPVVSDVITVTVK
ncbi:MAG: DUF4399 domain-containing protein [Alphaproteobacteria bacterium]|nr:DUF4399 domain-containing protein [Alphaproteobacteria bacterium]